MRLLSCWITWPPFLTIAPAHATPMLKVLICCIDERINNHLRDITFDYFNNRLLRGNVLDNLHHSSGPTA
jgi:hypothetical protein